MAHVRVGVKSAAVCLRLPVYPYQQTSSRPVSMSQTCQIGTQVERRTKSNEAPIRP